MFTDKEHWGPFEFSEEIGNISMGAQTVDNVMSVHRVEANDNEILVSTSEKEDTKGLSNINGSTSYDAPAYDASNIAHVASQTQSETTFPTTTMPAYGGLPSLAIDDLLGLGQPDAPARAPSPPLLKLNSKAVIDPTTFQRKWGQLPVSFSQASPAWKMASAHWQGRREQRPLLEALISVTSPMSVGFLYAGISGNFKNRLKQQSKKDEMKWKILVRKIVRAKNIVGAPFFSSGIAVIS